ncbi:MAG: hypothetical protein KatS3mg087_0284 [Patescibacteria group bacterium]|nr:MAG: hypothetical protein KatS3mg087_0284 [Patescibacteria group bacterium]
MRSRIRSGSHLDPSIYGWVRQDTGEEAISLVKYSKLKKENEELRRLIGDSHSKRAGKKELIWSKQVSTIKQLLK